MRFIALTNPRAIFNHNIMKTLIDLLLDESEDLLLEDATDNLVAIIKSKDPQCSEQEIAEILSTLKSIDQKKGNDSKRLLEFYYQVKSWETLKQEYDIYLDLLKKQLVKKDINSFRNFNDWTEYTHSLQAGLKKKTAHSLDKVEISSHFTHNYGDIPLVYKTDEIKVYAVRNVADAIKLGHGLPYTGQPFCICRTSNNLYNGYRRTGSTFYFIFYSSNRENLEGGNVCVLDAKGGSYTLTFINNATQTFSESDIVNKFPELKVPFSKGVFKHVPFSKEEKDSMATYEKCAKNFEAFKSLQPKQLQEYVEYAYDLDFERLKFLVDNGYDQLVNDWCGKGL